MSPIATRAPETIDVGAPPTRWRLLTDPASPTPIYLGVGLTLAGFIMLGIGWAKVAGEVDVFRQFPYLLSVGLPGLGLIMAGLILVNISVRRQDSAERARQLSALTEAMSDLQRAIERP